MSNYQFEERAYHSSVIIGDNVFVWGGYTEDLPLVHDSPEKRQLTSSVETFNLLTSKWEKRPTTGSPPNGTMYYSCSNIGDEIYYFGGTCDFNDCHHNNLFVLNTSKWREVECSDNRPMKKTHCGMISFSSGGKDYLLVIGGEGPVPANAPVHSQYTPLSTNSSHCRTNEIHVMCVSSSLGKWTVPVRTGDHFPPCNGPTINTLPGNKAVVFGGVVTDDRGREHCTNNVFTISFTDNSVDFQRLVKPSDSTVQWPKERYCHSSVVISSVSSDGVKRPHLVVMGGLDDDDDVIPDCWVIDIENKHWRQILAPESVTKRLGHSMTSFSVSMNCVWLVITGGATGHDPVTSPNIVMIVELVFSPADNQWSVSNVMNSEDMKKKDQYSKLLFDRLTEGRRQYQMMETGKEMQQVIRREQKEQEVKLCKELEELQRRMDEVQLQHCEELDRLKQERNRQHQTEVNTLQGRLEQERNQADQQRIEADRQYQAELSALQEEVEELRDRLESRPWVLERDEVALTNEKIGGGAYGEVKVAVFRGTRVAAKCLHELIVSDYNRGVFTREMEISSRIHHPNIVQFVGATRVNNPILLYELMATSLRKKLQEGQPLTHPQIKDTCCDIASALSYLHLWKPDPIIHRDVSSPNVLMEPLANGRWRSKLSDFGSANLQLHVKTIIPGNPAYASPESLVPQHHSPAMDIYSFGVLITEMVLCRPPEMESTKRDRQARGIVWRPMKAIVLRCINSDRSQRPTSLRLLQEIKNVE